MKRKYIQKSILCLGLLAAMSCTDNFDEINSDPQGSTAEQLAQDFNNITGYSKVMFNFIFEQDPLWGYQIQQNLQGDVWSGYMATPNPFGSNNNNMTYNLVNGWNGRAWDDAYTNVMANALKIEHETKTKGLYPEIYAMSQILKVEAMHRITDIYGPIVYSKYSSESSVKEYDSQEQVYTQMFADLDEAIVTLSKAADSGESSIITKADFSKYGGSYSKWVKFANSLRLRLAMRLAVKAPAVAKEQAEKSISQKYGVMLTKDDSFVFLSDFTNPVYGNSNSYEDINMSADMESILVGYNDPRLSKYFAVSVKYPGEYKGIRTGIVLPVAPDGATKAARKDFSKVGEAINVKETVFLSTAEVFFLRAEGALRGWNMGSDVQSLYEAGITASFEQFGVSSSTYKTSTALPKAYVDPLDATNNAAAVNNVTVAWEAGASNEVKLQKIITQKWIAGFPDGQEAWTEWRRTGYPKLFPITNNTSNGVISSQLGVRRVNFVASEIAGNKDGVATGIAKLGGPDNGATRLWWDTGVNF
ncbi:MULTISPECIES: RagB/SusD family nutrient uptake outer membrane protein [Flavobacterium]|uniref:SusD/RagB family nutrient-binding outer membrane lipoprotein n=1 Tax=Flavobacterium ginsengisoli TaxID=871694 RepID=A0ABP7FTT0_9FLAO|nr:RagB/SusD family nutrient uptake outer membrane protein [Flavobacterium sp. IB48]MBJ2124901.1 SusD/RagB family nutrient-binding outer membrane lipoprotein [Flavobacterium sp. IB48]